MIGVSANSPTQRNPLAGSARLSVNLNTSAAAVAAVVLCACGSLDEISTGGSEGDAGMSTPENGLPTSPFIDASTPQPTGDGGAFGPTDAHTPVRDAGFFDSGAVVDSGATDAGSPPPPPPKRVVFIYASHGFSCRNNDWKPTDSRNRMVLTGRLEPFAPFRDRLVLVDGLDATPHPTSPDRPPGARSCWEYTRATHGCEGHAFGGSHPDLSRSPDHHLVSALDGVRLVPPLFGGLYTPVRSALLTRPLNGFSVGEGRHSPLETDPTSFLQLATGLVSRSPTSEAEELLRRLRSESASIDNAQGTARGRFFLDTVATAFAHDTTRVATFVLGYNELVLPELVSFDNWTLNEAIHQAYYSGGSPNLCERYQQWFVDEVAHFAETLDGIPDGTGTLLDHTLIVWFTDTGQVHASTNVPVFLLGGALPTLPFGEYITVDDGRLIDLFTTIGVGFGVPEGAMGHPSAPGRVLPELAGW